MATAATNASWNDEPNTGGEVVSASPYKWRKGGSFASTCVNRDAAVAVSLQVVPQACRLWCISILAIPKSAATGKSTAVGP